MTATLVKKKPKKKTVNLPDTMHELLRIAIDDMLVVKTQKKYVLNMGEWYAINNDNRCSVCMAGSVMARRCKFDRTKDCLPSSFPRDISTKLSAINQMRCNWLSEAYTSVYGEEPIGDKEDVLLNAPKISGWYSKHDPSENECTFRQFVSELNKLHKYLAKAGI